MSHAELIEVVMANDVESLKRHFIKSTHSNIVDAQGYTLLMLAVDSGSLESTRFLINNDYSINVAMQDGTTALYIAVSAGYQDIAAYLLDVGANINTSVGNDQTSPLMVSVMNNDLAMTRLLLSRGANPDQKDKNGWTARSYTESPQILALLNIPR